MPHFDIVRHVEPNKTFRVASVMGTYDLQTEKVAEHFVGDIELPEQWQVGLIVGNSGTGKTTIARELFADAYIENFDYTHESILDDMPQGIPMETITKTFNAVGFSSPPSWLKPYAVLSNGEKMRCDLARAMLSDNEMFVFDEFTSVVDRNIAKIGSFAIQKAIRKTNRRMIAVTCHFDVEDWLMPDWVFCTNDMTFHIRDGQKKNRPTIRCDIYQVTSPNEKSRLWRTFGKYHYLSANFNKVADVFVTTVNGDLAAFCAALPFPHPRLKKVRREHRTVVLPDFQGIGLGVRLSDFVAEQYRRKGYRYISTTSNPAMAHYRINSPKWVIKKLPHRTATSKSSFKTGIYKNAKASAAMRLTYSFEYIGDAKSQKSET